MTGARDFRKELRELKRTGEISTPSGQERLRENLKILGVNLDNPGGEYDTHFEVRTEPFTDEELWENTPPCFWHLLPPEVIQRFDTEELGRWLGFELLMLPQSRYRWVRFKQKVVRHHAGTLIWPSLCCRKLRP